LRENPSVSDGTRLTTAWDETQSCRPVPNSRPLAAGSKRVHKPHAWRQLVNLRRERSLISDHFDWRRTLVAEHVRFVRGAGLREFSAAEETLIQERTPRRWDSVESDESADAA
jgi:hypothetical protein